MSVSVINQRGKPLMPCSDRKARVLLKQGRAKLECKNYKQVGFKNIKLLCNNNNWQFIPHLKEGDFLPKII